MGKIVANPFQAGGMIRDEARFFGRQREVNSILRRVATLQSVSVFGARRIGKSSLLFHVAQVGPKLLADETITFHYLDLQPLTSPAEFYNNACQLIADEDGATHDDLEAALEDKKVVLCLDEFEQSIEAEFGEDFFKSLRSLAQSGRLALVVSTKQPLNELYRLHQQESDLTSSFHNIFTSLPLGEFAPTETEEFLDLQCRREFFEREECSKIRELAGNHPYLLNLACHIAFELKQEGSTNFARQLKEWFDRERLADNGAPQRKAMASAAKVAASVTPTAREQSGWTRVLVLVLIGMIIGGFSARNSNMIGIILAGSFILAGFFQLLFTSWKLPKESQ